LLSLGADNDTFDRAEASDARATKAGQATSPTVFWVCFGRQVAAGLALHVAAFLSKWGTAAEKKVGSNQPTQAVKGVSTS